MKKQFTPAQKAYFAKLRDPRWQKRKTQILELAGWKCEDCGDKEETLNVHHCHYLQGKEPWEHPDNLLMSLCETCHPIRQEIERTIHINVASVLRDKTLEEIRELPIYAFFANNSEDWK